MIIYGINPLKFRLDNNLSVHRVWLSRTDSELINALQKRGISYHLVENNFLLKMAGPQHQGCVFEIDDFQYSQLSEIDLTRVIIILDGIEDPHNLGAIIRSAEATNCSSIIIRDKRSAAVNATVYKVSTGAIDNIDIVMVNNLSNCIKFLKQHGYWIVGLEGTAETSFDTINYDLKTALVIGSEGSGISQLVAKNCDYLVKLPMGGKVNSLNASNAAAIMLYYLFTKNKK